MKHVLLLALLLTAFLPANAVYKARLHPQVIAALADAPAASIVTHHLNDDDQETRVNRRQRHRERLAAVAAHKYDVARRFVYTGVGFIIGGVASFILGASIGYTTGLGLILLGVLALGFGLLFSLIAIILFLKYGKYMRHRHAGAW